MKKILLVFGTRPEAVKMCPLVLELKKRKNIQTIVCVTGQHREMLMQVLDFFGVVPDYNLDIMKERQDLFHITEDTLSGIRTVAEKEKPDLVLVHGDTTTSFAAALSCFYLGIPVGHVEAGLRTYKLDSPYPEEYNRQAIDAIARIHFAPTETAMRNLRREGKASGSIFLTGNTGIDAFRYTVKPEYTHPELSWAEGSRLLLITAHRRENTGAPMRRMFRAIRRVIEDHPDVKAIYPVHRNPEIRAIAIEELGGCDRIHLIEPLDLAAFHNFEARCFLCLTDSGGLQEELPFFGKPVLVLRDTTERPEGISLGAARLVGTEEETVAQSLAAVLDDPALYTSFTVARNLYGDGHASERIVDICIRFLCSTGSPENDSSIQREEK